MKNIVHIQQETETQRQGNNGNKKSEPLGQRWGSAFQAKEDALELRKISGSTYQQKLCNPVRL